MNGHPLLPHLPLPHYFSPKLIVKLEMSRKYFRENGDILHLACTSEKSSEQLVCGKRTFSFMNMGYNILYFASAIRKPPNPRIELQ
jgi:hypothetical protein